MDDPSAAASASAAHARLSSAFLSGTTRPLSWRTSQLRAVLNMLRLEAATFHASLAADLGKSAFESDMTELILVRNSAALFLRHLPSWMSGRSATSTLPWFFRFSRTSARIVPQPLGVALIFSPWNFPLLLALDPLVAAIAAGNSVALKPSELSPATSAALSRLLPLYLDPSAVSVLTGGPSTSISLLSHRWDKIFFTGSPSVARSIMSAASSHLTPLTLELGGKCPALVHRSADLRSAARRIASGKWALNAGQTCIAPDYVLVDSSAAPAFLAFLAAALRDFGFGAAAAAAQLPHIVNKVHWERLRSMKEEALSGGAVEVKWWQEEERETKDAAATSSNSGEINGNGDHHPRDEEVAAKKPSELYMAPTILHNPAAASRVMNEEIFGPILPVVEVEDVMKDGMVIMRGKGRPLAMYVFSEELGSQVWKDPGALLAPCGTVVINDATTQFSLENIPFGGVGDSGMGAYHGRYGFDAFSHDLPVVSFKASPDPDVRYPPYSSKAQTVLAAISMRRGPAHLLRLLLWGSAGSSD